MSMSSALRQQAAELAIKSMGITFTVYHEQGGSIDRAWPLDIIPRIISRREWVRIEAGLRQRVMALNLFIDDIYHDQRILADGIVPREIIASPPTSGASASASARRSAAGRTSAALIWCATRTAPSMCSRTTCAFPRASPT